MATRRFAFITRSVRAEPSFGEGLVRAAIAVAIPTAISLVIDGGTSGAPLLLYFPPIQLIATYLGWRWGAVTAVGSGIAGWGFLMLPDYSFSLTSAQIVTLSLFAVSATTMVIIGHVLRLSVFELKERAQQSDDFNSELQHRTKNALQMMRALASQASRATDPAEFYDMLAGRLGALAKANELLRFGALRSCEIGALVDAAVAPFTPDRFELSGPKLAVARSACTPLMMALHELATNASKYGALSAPGGKVRIVWRRSDEEQRFLLRWEEVGGPPVVAPTRKGMGTRLLQPSAGVREVELRFAPTGVVCEMKVAGS